jgi:hypothetical protein
MVGTKKPLRALALGGLIALVGCSNKAPKEVSTAIRINSPSNATFHIWHNIRNYSNDKIEEESVYLGVAHPLMKKIGNISSRNPLYEGDIEGFKIPEGEFGFTSRYYLLLCDNHTGEIKHEAELEIPNKMQLLNRYFESRYQKIIEKQSKKPWEKPDISLNNRTYESEDNKNFLKVSDVSILVDGDTNKLQKAWENFLKLK